MILCDAPTSYGATWADDGLIYFLHHENMLARVSEDGGEPRDVIGAWGGPTQPSALPGGRGVLVFTRPGTSRLSRDGELEALLDDAYHASYSPSGHLLFMRAGDLHAVPFDLDRMEIAGESVRVVDNVWSDSMWGSAQYDVSLNGTLAYVEGGDPSLTLPSWIDRDGEEEALAMEPEVYGVFELSPDQRHLAFNVRSPGEDDIYIFDPAEGISRRLTLQGGDFSPRWTPDGRRIIFQSRRDGVSSPFWMPVDGSGEAELIQPDVLADAEVIFTKPSSISPDGKFLLFETGTIDIWLLPLFDGEEPRPIVATASTEVMASFSPDGRWITYLSDQTGRFEVFVRPFPDSDRRVWQVSNGGGDDPEWSPTGNELLYRDGTTMMSVSFTTKPDFSPAAPRLVFQTEMHNTTGFSFDVSSDGARFLIHKSVVGARRATKINIVHNWFEELNRLVPID